MARQRIIKPAFFADEQLAAIPPHGRLLFAGLWGLADKRGRLRDQPPVIRGQVFPFEPEVDVDGLLDALQDAGSVLRYEVDGRKYLSVKNFEREQNPHPKEAESLLPAPPALYRPAPRKAAAQPCNSTDEPCNSTVPSFLRSFVPSVPDPVPNPETVAVPEAPRLPPPEPAPAGASAPDERDPGQLWETAKTRLAGVVPRHSFGTWIRPVTVARWDAGVLVVEAPNAQFHRWLTANYREQVRAAFDALEYRGPIRFACRARDPAEVELHEGSVR